MIFVDDRRIDFTSFPDGTSSIRIAPKLDFTFFAMGKSAYFIRWMYDNDAECMQLWYLVKHLKSAGNPLLYLEMPYIPNARMDRVKNRDEVFTLKWFAEFINSLGFESVKVLDPHSNVAMALINRAETIKWSPASQLPEYAIRRKAIVTKFEYKPLRSFTADDIKLLRLDYASQDDPQLLMEEYLPIKNFELLYGWWKQHYKATLKDCDNPQAIILHLASTN